jgi:hypothetical protein
MLDENISGLFLFDKLPTTFNPGKITSENWCRRLSLWSTLGPFKVPFNIVEITGILDGFQSLFPLVEAETPAQTTEEQEENGADVAIASSKPVGPCFGSGSAWIRIDFGRLDPDPEIFMYWYRYLINGEPANSRVTD